MSTFGLVWVGGILPAAVLCAAALEWERRRSPHEDVRRYARLPGVAGVAGGVCWPLTLTCVLAAGMVWVIGRSGRTVLDLLGVQ